MVADWTRQLARPRRLPPKDVPTRSSARGTWPRQCLFSVARKRSPRCAERGSQDRLVAALSQLFPQGRVLDLRVRPSHGYRAVHVVPMIDGYRVDVQVRTTLQHWWAELSETLALGHVAPELQYGGDVPERPGTRDRLLLLSDVIAAFEESPDGLTPMSRLVTALGIGLVGDTMVTQWKGRLEKEAAHVFEGPERKGGPPVDVDARYRKIGQIEAERDFLASRPGIISALQRGRRGSSETPPRSRWPGRVASWG